MRKQLLDFLGKSACCLRLTRVAAACKLFHPRVIAMVDGGLGSQMHQFALGYSIAQKKGLPLYLETDFFEKSGMDGKGVHNRHFLLPEVFPKIREEYSLRMTSGKDNAAFALLFSDRYLKRKVEDFTPGVFNPHPVYLRQYYMNAQYLVPVRAELRDIFRFEVRLSPEEAEWKASIASCRNACYVHVRKGDFVGSVHDVCSDAYYRRAMQKMCELYPDVHFFVFSNDEAYAQHLCGSMGLSVPITYLTGRSEGTPQVDMYLMTLCRHGIISNSGFSWFPRFLSDDSGTSILPDKWKRGEDAFLSSDSYRLPGWLDMPCRD